MPKKKTPQNPFFFFMMDYRKEQAEIGIKYANTKELAEAAGPVWQVCIYFIYRQTMILPA